MATAHDATSLSQFKSQVPPWSGGSFKVVKLHVDLPAIVADLGITIDGSAGDTLKIWKAPIGCQIHGALLDVKTACTDTGTATISLGDGGAAAGYLAATSIKTVAKTGMVVGDAYGAASKVYAALSDINLTFGGTEADIDSGVFDIYLICSFINF